MTPVAPRIVNHVSCVTKINHESHFSWQMHYLVETSSKNCKNSILKALSLSLSLPQSAKLRKPQSTLSLSLKVQKCENPQSVVSLSLSISLSLSLKVQNCGNLKVPSLSLRVQKCENPQSVVSLSLSKCKTVETSKFSFSFKYEI